MGTRALSFGSVAAAYERYRPGYPGELVDEVLVYAGHAARAPFLETDSFPPPDRTPGNRETQADGMTWPGTELTQSRLFTDVRQTVIERRMTVTASDYLGHLSTISAYLELPVPVRAEAFERIGQVLPNHVAITADITAHLARRAS